MTVRAQAGVLVALAVSFAINLALLAKLGEERSVADDWMTCREQLDKFITIAVEACTAARVNGKEPPSCARLLTP